MQKIILLILQDVRLVILANIPVKTGEELKYLLSLARTTSSSSVYRGGGSIADGGILEENRLLTPLSYNLPVAFRYFVSLKRNSALASIQSLHAFCHWAWASK